MAQSPDGKAAKTERVTFTRPAAERIAKVVRKVESGDRNGAPWAPSPRFVPEQSGVVFRVCNFTGAWEIGSVKNITIKNPAITPNTVNATNLFWPIPDGPPRDCAIGREGNTWYLLVPSLNVVDVFTSVTLTDTSLDFKTLPALAMATSGTSVFSVIPKTITPLTDVELTSDALNFTRVNAGVFFMNTAATVSISITTCSTAAT